MSKQSLFISIPGWLIYFKDGYLGIRLKLYPCTEQQAWREACLRCAAGEWRIHPLAAAHLLTITVEEVEELRRVGYAPSLVPPKEEAELDQGDKVNWRVNKCEFVNAPPHYNSEFIVVNFISPAGVPS